jgi:hypothetical protein
MAELEDLQNATDLPKEVRDIMGLNNWSAFKSKSEKSEKISVLLNFVIDSYGIFFDVDDSDKIGDEAVSLELITSFEDVEFETTEEQVEAIISINQILEEEDFIDDEIKVNIKTILVYILELLQDES